MATTYPAPVSAFKVGSYFVGQYYQALQQHPYLVHQFYTDASTMVRVDGDESNTASSLLAISNLTRSLLFSAFKIKTINSLESWDGGILVMVSGSVKTKDFGLRRKFVETFFLAPQEMGYFVLNDIFQFSDEEIVYQQHPASLLSENIYKQHHTSQQHHTAPIMSEDAHDSQLNPPTPIPEPPGVSDHVLEDEAREAVSSVRIEDDPIDKYSLSEQQQEQDSETELVVEETAVETPSSFFSALNAVQDAPAVGLEEHVEEPQKKTYASVLRGAKGQFSASIPTQPSPNRCAPTASDWDPISPPTAQQPDSGLSLAQEPGYEASEELELDEGEPKSVYVGNLSSDVTAAEIEQEFQHFGRIKPGGVFVRSRKDALGACFAFVEFEDHLSAQNAIKASPIQLAGRQVYIQEQWPTSRIVSRGGRRGRGRGDYQRDAPRGRFGARSFGREFWCPR